MIKYYIRNGDLIIEKHKDGKYTFCPWSFTHRWYYQDDNVYGQVCSPRGISIVKLNVITYAFEEVSRFTYK